MSDQSVVIAITSELKTFIEERDNAVEQRVKFWIVSVVLANIIALIPVIFFLGGIYNNANATLEVVKTQQIEMDQRGRWMQSRERWEDAVEMWAEPQGFRPPRYERERDQ